jgi:hypothetical protein
MRIRMKPGVLVNPLVIAVTLVTLSACSSPKRTDTKFSARSVVPPPSGFHLSSRSGVYNGAVDSTKFDSLIGAPRSAELFGFVMGYNETFDSDQGDDTIEIDLAQFKTASVATQFNQRGITVEVGLGATESPVPGLAGAVELDGTKPLSDGVYHHLINNVRGRDAMSIEFTTNSPARVELLPMLAKEQAPRL